MLYYIEDQLCATSRKSVVQIKMKSDMSIEEASKRLEVTFKETERRLDVIGDKVDSALVDCENQKGTSNCCT